MTSIKPLIFTYITFEIMPCSLLVNWNADDLATESKRFDNIKGYEALPVIKCHILVSVL